MNSYLRLREEIERYVRKEYLHLSKFIVAVLIALSASFLYENQTLRHFLDPFEKKSIEWRAGLKSGTTPQVPAQSKTTVDGLVQNGVLRPASGWMNFFVLWFMTGCVSLIVLLSGYIVSTLRMLLLTALFISVNLAVFVWSGIVLNFVYPIAVMLLCFAVLTAYHQVITAVEERRLIGLIEKDALTELYNFKHLKLMLDAQLKEAFLHPDRKVSIVMMDLDHFKEINDRFGHAAGDEVIQAASNLIRSNCRSIDLACRYGGEEFLLVLPGASVEDAGRAAERIRKSLESIPFNLGDDKRQVTVTASFGVAAYFTGEETNDLIRRSDKALYKAKEAGRNMVCRV